MECGDLALWSAVTWHRFGSVAEKTPPKPLHLPVPSRFPLAQHDVTYHALLRIDAHPPTHPKRCQVSALRSSLSRPHSILRT